MMDGWLSLAFSVTILIGGIYVVGAERHHSQHLKSIKTVEQRTVAYQPVFSPDRQ
jgi:hypothetical protein